MCLFRILNNLRKYVATVSEGRHSFGHHGHRTTPEALRGEAGSEMDGGWKLVK